MFPDRRTVNSLFHRALKPSCHNLCSNSCIRCDACLLTNAASKTQYSICSNRAKGVAVLKVDLFGTTCSLHFAGNSS